ncbi:MAG: DUF1566 domain-containing protein, partial [Xanthomonadales bacterium]|nr:DUF1566 domain-containing protein [Xanthomonadales bacterium]
MATGLMWKRCREALSGANCATGTGSAVSWSAAFGLANASTHAGFSDWRLPNREELRSLVETACFNPSINTTAFPGMSPELPGMFWSSTTLPTGFVSSSAWWVGFGSGVVDFNDKDAILRVRLVRGGQWLDAFASEADSVPDAFALAAQSGVPFSSERTSDPVTVAGLTTVTGIGVSGAAGSSYSINGGAYTSRPDAVKNGDVVRVRHTSAATAATATTTTLTIGGITANFVSTTSSCAGFSFPYTLAGANNLARVANLRTAIECANANGAGTDTIDLNAQILDLEANNVYAVYDGPTGLPQIASGIVLRNGRLRHDYSAGGTQFRTFDIAATGTLTLNSVWLIGDSAPSPGGAFYNRGALSVSHTVITGYSTSNRGGVLFNAAGATANFSNAILYGNRAVFAHVIDNAGSVTIVNSTFNKHTSVSNFGSILTGTGYVVRNSILWNSGAGPMQIDAGNTVSNSIVRGGYAGGTNIMNTNPGFVFESGDFYNLRDFSPAIDAGNNADAAALTTDFDGNPRFYNDTGVTDTGTGTPPIVDLGAYEKQTNSPLSAVSIAVSPTSVLEDGATNLTYTVTRNLSLPTPTTVNISVSGTATSSSDYGGAVATIVIPAGATTATFNIDPMADTAVEPDETVIMTVALGAGYTVGSPSSATGTIQNDDVDLCAAISFPYTLPNNLPATLIQAIQCANANGTADSIELNGQTVTLTDSFGNFSGATGLPQITTPVTLRGGTITRSGSNEFRLLQVSGTGNLTLRNMTLTNGGGVSYLQQGGIVNASTNSSLTIINSLVSGGSVSNGTNAGGIFASGTFNLVNSTVSGNTAGRGGGLNLQNGPALISNSVISGNVATSFLGGGAMYLPSISVTVVNSTITGNYATATDTGATGGILSDISAATLTLRNTIVWGNSNIGGTAAQIVNASGTNTASNSIIQGGQFGALNVDPLFITPITASSTPSTAGNFTLQNSSPAIDAGANANVPADAFDVNGNSNTTEDAPDRAGNPRRFNDTGVTDTGSGTAPIVDLGAFEKQTNSTAPADFNITTTANSILVVDNTGNGSTLQASEPVANTLRLAATGRTFSVNGGAPISGNSGNLALTGITSITVNAAGGVSVASGASFNIGASAYASASAITLAGGTLRATGTAVVNA